MINKVVKIAENDPMYDELTKIIDSVTDDDLVIVGRSYKNRKAGLVKPLTVKNGIYFYLGYSLHGMAGFISSPTPEQISKAKENMCRRARIGDMQSIVFTGGDTLKDFEYTGNIMNVATLDCSMYGAGLLYCEEFIKAMEEKIGDCYILPSSIHELIFVPAVCLNGYDATEMVKGVNAEMIDDDIYLADRAFRIREWID